MNRNVIYIYIYIYVEVVKRERERESFVWQSSRGRKEERGGVSRFQNLGETDKIKWAISVMYSSNQ